jgi:hypothetical protein
LLSAIGIHSQAFDKKLQQNYLVLYPNIDIKESWTDECDKMDYHQILLIQHLHLEKVKDKKV